MAEKEYYSFEEVLKDLKLEENELKRLVSAGEIRAFRDKNTMRFKAEDVARLKGGGAGSEEIELDDLELDLDEPAAAAVAAAPAAEELVLEDAEAPAAQVEELDLGAEPAAETAAAPARTRAGREAGPGKRAPRAAAAAEPEGKDSPLLLAALVAGVLLLVVANFAVFDAVTGSSSNPLSEMVANMFG